jgi:hypothetical protein
MYVHLVVCAHCVCTLHHNFIRLSGKAKIWEDYLRQFLEKKEASNPLQEVWKMCQHLNRNGHDSGSYFKQVCLIGCVRAGVTRLDKNLVGVFDLRCETMCCCR